MLAARFERQGAKVYLLARNEERAKTIRERGIVVRGLAFERVLRGPVFCPKSFEQESKGLKFTLQLSCVKSHAFEELVTLLSKHSNSAPLLVFQNGLLWPDLASRKLPNQPIFGAMTTEAALRKETSEGMRVVHTGEGQTRLAALSRKSESELGDLVQRFGRLGLPCRAESSLQGMLWDKAIVNAAINALTGLLLVPNGALIEESQSAELADRAAQECCNVADALGVQRSVEADHWREVARKTAANGSSTLQDVVAQRRTEVSAINGVIAEKGRKLGVDVTVNNLLTKLMSAREENYRRSQSMLTLGWTTR